MLQDKKNKQDDKPS